MCSQTATYHNRPVIPLIIHNTFDIIFYVKSLVPVLYNM